MPVFSMIYCGSGSSPLEHGVHYPSTSFSQPVPASPPNKPTGSNAIGHPIDRRLSLSKPSSSFTPRSQMPRVKTVGKFFRSCWITCEEKPFGTRSCIWITQGAFICNYLIACVLANFKQNRTRIYTRIDQGPTRLMGHHNLDQDPNGLPFHIRQPWFGPRKKYCHDSVNIIR